MLQATYRSGSICRRTPAIGNNRIEEERSKYGHDDAQHASFYAAFDAFHPAERPGNAAGGF
jgi:hypothetical protein